MRSLVATALFVVISCRPALAPPVPEVEGANDPAELRVLSRGGYGREGPDQPTVLVATSESEFREFWQRYVGDPPPRVDFSRESAVFLLLGNRSTGGYSIEPRTVAISGDDVRIEAPVTSPGRESIVTMALTAPFAVVAVPRPGVESAAWLDRDRVMARGERKRR